MYILVILLIFPSAERLEVEQLKIASNFIFIRHSNCENLKQKNR